MFLVAGVGLVFIHLIHKMLLRFEEQPEKASQNFVMALQEASERLKTHEAACWLFMAVGLLWGIQELVF